MCERGAVRRKTLYALAGVDAEAAEVETSAVLASGDEKRFISMAAADEAAAASNTHRTRSRAATGTRRGKKVPKVPWFLGWLLPRRGRGRDRASDSSPLPRRLDDDDAGRPRFDFSELPPPAGGRRRRPSSQDPRLFARHHGGVPEGGEGDASYDTVRRFDAPEDDPYRAGADAAGASSSRRSAASVVPSARRRAPSSRERRISARSRVRAASAMAHEREEEEEGQEEQTREEDDARGVMSGGGVVSE